MGQAERDTMGQAGRDTMGQAGRDTMGQHRFAGPEGKLVKYVCRKDMRNVVRAQCLLKPSIVLGLPRRTATCQNVAV
jgi:hypothetical protein